MQRHIYIVLHKHQFFPHIVLNDIVNTCLFLNNGINRLLCAVVVAEYCLLSSDKKERNTACRGRESVDELIYACGAALKCSNAISYIDTDLFPP